MLGSIDTLADVRTLAVNEACGAVWAFDGSRLHGFTPDGIPPFGAEGPIHAASPSSALAVDGDDGSAWLAVSDRLFHFAPDGVLLHQGVVPGRGQGSPALALDVLGERIWAASGALWLALATPHNGLRRLDADLRPQLEIALPRHGPPLERLALDARGAAWAASKQWLYRYDARGEPTLELRLFAGQGLGPGALDLAPNRADGSFWVGLGRHLLHLDPEGTPRHLLEMDLPLEGLAAYADAHPPALRFTAPRPGAFLATARAELALAHEDADSGVNGETLLLDLDGARLATRCDRGEAAATCVAIEPLPEGEHTVSATVADHAGNRSGAARVSFTVDTTAPAIPAAGRIVVSVDEGLATVRGEAGSVESGARILVRNPRNGEQITVSADPSGAFEARIGAEPGDVLSIAAVNRAGNASESLALPTAAPLRLAITAPRDGAALVAQRIRLEGTHDGAPNSGIVVHGVLARVTEDRFVAEEVPLLAGANTLTARLATGDGRSAEARVTVTTEA